MKIFMSYSVSDGTLVELIARYISQHAELYYWDRSRAAGSEVWPSIFDWIDQSDLVLALITGNTVARAMAVGQEIGRAKAKGKLIIPIVTAEVPVAELGFLGGVTYQSIERHNPGPAIAAIERMVLARKQQMESQQAMLLLGGIVTLLWLGSDRED